MTPARRPARIIPKQEQVRDICARRGIAVIPLAGHGYHLYGRGVDIKVADLRFVHSIDLKSAEDSDQ